MVSHVTPVIPDPSFRLSGAGIQVRGVDPHVTPIIPHNHDSIPSPPTPPDILPFTNQNTRSNINLSRVLTRRPCKPTLSGRNGGQLRGIEVSSPRIKARYD